MTVTYASRPGFPLSGNVAVGIVVIAMEYCMILSAALMCLLRKWKITMSNDCARWTANCSDLSSRVAYVLDSLRISLPQRYGHRQLYVDHWRNRSRLIPRVLHRIYRTAGKAENSAVAASAKEVMFSPVPVCLSVCLSVNRITQKPLTTLLWNFMEGWHNPGSNQLGFKWSNQRSKSFFANNSIQNCHRDATKITV